MAAHGAPAEELAQRLAGMLPDKIAAAMDLMPWEFRDAVVVITGADQKRASLPYARIHS